MLGRKTTFALAVGCLVSALLSFTPNANAETFLDGGTQQQLGVQKGFVGKLLSVHVCGRGNAVMQGVHVGQNQFLCTDRITSTLSDGSTRTWVPAYTRGEVTSNYVNNMPYQSNGMAACPPGYAMVGLHAGENVLACAYVARSAPAGNTLQLWVDSSTQHWEGRLSLHSCGEGAFMVGIHVGNNLLLCGRYR
jgi:hypothetical protein